MLNGYLALGGAHGVDCDVARHTACPEPAVHHTSDIARFFANQSQQWCTAGPHLCFTAVRPVTTEPVHGVQDGELAGGLQEEQHQVVEKLPGRGLALKVLHPVHLQPTVNSRTGQKLGHLDVRLAAEGAVERGDAGPVPPGAARLPAGAAGPEPQQDTELLPRRRHRLLSQHRLLAGTRSWI